MRLKKIKTHAEANLFLEKEYLPEHNRRFRRIPAQPEDYHRAAPRAAELEDVFHLETGRILGNDWVVRHDNRHFQVQAQSRQYAPAKGKVTVCEWEDGRLQFRYRGRAVSWKEIPDPVPVQAATPGEATAQKQKPPTPKADHPWRQDYRKMRPREQARNTARNFLQLSVDRRPGREHNASQFSSSTFPSIRPGSPGGFKCGVYLYQCTCPR